jgi:hypothetical protein
MPESSGAGVAIFDYNNDGWMERNGDSRQIAGADGHESFDLRGQQQFRTALKSFSRNLERAQSVLNVTARGSIELSFECPQGELQLVPHPRISGSS